MKNVDKMSVQELQQEQTKVEGGLSDCENIAAEFRNQLQLIKAELSRRLKPAPEPRVSDHALMRYIERVIGIDVGKIRSEILTDRAKEALRAGATGYSINGVKFKAKNGVLVTVLDK